MDNTKIGERISEAREQSNLKQNVLAEIVGVAPSTIQRYEAGVIKKIKLPVIESIAKALDVNPMWLIGKTDKKKIECSASPNNPLSVETKKIPMLGEIACGDLTFLYESYAEYYIEIKKDVNVDFCIKAKGDSMINARILDGDIVFIRKQADVEDGEIAAVLIDDEATLKRVYKMPDRIQLRAENPKYQPIEIFLDEYNTKNILILGKAISFYGEIK